MKDFPGRPLREGKNCQKDGVKTRGRKEKTEAGWKEKKAGKKLH